MGKKKARGRSGVKASNPHGAIRKLTRHSRLLSRIGQRVLTRRSGWMEEMWAAPPYSPSAAAIERMEREGLQGAELEEARTDAWRCIAYELKKPIWLSHLELPPLPPDELATGLETCLELMLALGSDLETMCYGGSLEERLAAATRVQGLKARLESSRRSVPRLVHERMVECVERGSLELEAHPEHLDRICTKVHAQIASVFPSSRLQPDEPLLKDALRNWVTNRGPAVLKRPIWATLCDLLRRAGTQAPKAENLSRMYRAFKSRPPGV